MHRLTRALYRSYCSGHIIVPTTCNYGGNNLTLIWYAHYPLQEHAIMVNIYLAKAIPEHLMLHEIIKCVHLLMVYSSKDPGDGY